MKRIPHAARLFLLAMAAWVGFLGPALAEVDPDELFEAFVEPPPTGTPRPPPQVSHVEGELLYLLRTGREMELLRWLRDATPNVNRSPREVYLIGLWRALATLRSPEGIQSLREFCGTLNDEAGQKLRIIALMDLHRFAKEAGMGKLLGTNMAKLHLEDPSNASFYLVSRMDWLTGAPATEDPSDVEAAIPRMGFTPRERNMLYARLCQPLADAGRGEELLAVATRWWNSFSFQATDLGEYALEAALLRVRALLILGRNEEALDVVVGPLLFVRREYAPGMDAYMFVTKIPGYASAMEAAWAKRHDENTGGMRVKDFAKSIALHERVPADVRDWARRFVYAKSGDPALIRDLNEALLRMGWTVDEVLAELAGAGQPPEAAAAFYPKLWQYLRTPSMGRADYLALKLDRPDHLVQLKDDDFKALQSRLANDQLTGEWDRLLPGVVGHAKSAFLQSTAQNVYFAKLRQNATPESVAEAITRDFVPMLLQGTPSSETISIMFDLARKQGGEDLLLAPLLEEGLEERLPPKTLESVAGQIQFRKEPALRQAVLRYSRSLARAEPGNHYNNARLIRNLAEERNWQAMAEFFPEGLSDPKGYDANTQSKMLDALAANGKEELFSRQALRFHQEFSGNSRVSMKPVWQGFRKLGRLREAEIYLNEELNKLLANKGKEGAVIPLVAEGVGLYLDRQEASAAYELCYKALLVHDPSAKKLQAAGTQAKRILASGADVTPPYADWERRLREDGLWTETMRQAFAKWE